MRRPKRFLTVMKNHVTDIVIRTICPCCTGTKLYTLNMKEYQEWLDGKLIQDAFPELDDGDRERLISGICPDCWESYINAKVT